MSITRIYIDSIFDLILRPGGCKHFFVFGGLQKVLAILINNAYSILVVECEGVT